MDIREPDWTLWRSFRAVMQTGSLSAAARQLGLSQPTVGRHVAELESALGTALFTRAPDGLRPTAMADQLAPEAEAMAATAASLLRRASGESEAARGTIRLTSSDVVGAEVLPPILSAFHDANPETETAQYRLVVKGEPLTSAAGRVDDFAWPPSQRPNQAFIAPVAAVPSPETTGAVSTEDGAVEAN